MPEFLLCMYRQAIVGRQRRHGAPAGDVDGVDSAPTTPPKRLDLGSIPAMNQISYSGRVAHFNDLFNAPQLTLVFLKLSKQYYGT